MTLVSTAASFLKRKDIASRQLWPSLSASKIDGLATVSVDCLLPPARQRPPRQVGQKEAVLSTEYRKKRLKYAKLILESLPDPDDWIDVLFTDEASVQLHG